MDTVRIFDTTLRDGEQSPGFSMNVQDKLRLARQLEELGVDIIEAGFPIASRGDLEAVRAVAREVHDCQVAALARAKREDVDAALEAGTANFVEAAARAHALGDFRQRPEFLRLYMAFDRASRILPAQFDGRIDQNLIREPAERGLWEAVEKIRADVARVLPAGASGTDGMAALAVGYRKAFERLSAVADPVDRFFIDVLVMAEDPAVRATRLALLASVVNLVRPIADLSRVVVGEGKAVAGS
jgi:hypothetical protein